MRIITSDTMRSIDHKTISADHVEGKVLMQRAGKAAAREILNFTSLMNPAFTRRYVLVCGKGNNGGDGYVVARQLFRQGKNVKVFALCDPQELTGAALHHAQKLVNEVDIELIDHSINFTSGDFIIDCLLGTGLSRHLHEPYTSIIHSINNSGCAVASLDIASGLDGNDGKVLGIAVIADITLTIGLPKTGLFLQDGPQHTGRLKCLDIGFPQHIINDFPYVGELLCEHELRPFFKRRQHSSHKYQCGNVLIIGGSKNYSGAPFLAADACARSGAGMVSVVYPESIASAGFDALVKVPFAATEEGTFAPAAASQISPLLAKKDVLVIGPGMTGADAESYLFEAVLKSAKTLVIDAGAFLHLSKNPSLLNRQAHTVLTPHAGELSRLLKSTAMESASHFSKKYKVHLLVKGQFSELFSPEGKSIKCATGASALASAGSGDVLAGIIAAFLSWSDRAVATTVAHAVAVHGLCGEYLPTGTFGAVADDLKELIPTVLQSLSPFC